MGAPSLGGLATLQFLRTPTYVSTSTGSTTITELLIPEPVLVLLWIVAVLPLVTSRGVTVQ